MMGRRELPIDLQSVIKVAITYPIVWGYHQATVTHLEGFAQVAVVIVASVVTWIVLNRTLFPAMLASTPSNKQ